jgi:hypothetical protein
MKNSVVCESDDVVQDLFYKLCRTFQPVNRAENVYNECIVFGLPKLITLPRSHIKAIENYSGIKLFTDNRTAIVHSYDRFHVGEHFYTTSNYARSFKRNNSNIEIFSMKSFARIINIVVLSFLCNCNNDNIIPNCICNTLGGTFILCEPLKIDNSKKVRDTFVGIQLCPMIHKVLCSGSVLACKPSDIITKCALVIDDGDEFLVELPAFESD